MLPTTGLSESKNTGSQGWAQARGDSKLASKLGAGAKGYELHSEDDEAKVRVQKTWFTPTSSAEELPERSYSIESYRRSEELWQDQRDFSAEHAQQIPPGVSAEGKPYDNPYPHHA
ncbi:hypothetical protein V500_04229 [Pseudogymnoascus sp. VKM F-4518 (FW-2643)]|nr:hypothetical protein V500_04229 [Pseudogymnoascus sp. VKM F-4518 (FW-2643)]